MSHALYHLQMADGFWQSRVLAGKEISCRGTGDILLPE